MSAGTPLRTSQKLKLYGVFDEDDRHLAGRVLRPVDVGRQADAVAHRHHHLALDDGERLQLLLELPSCCHLFGGHLAAALSRHHSRGRDDRDRQSEEETTGDYIHGALTSVSRPDISVCR